MKAVARKVCSGIQSAQSVISIVLASTLSYGTIHHPTGRFGEQGQNQFFRGNPKHPTAAGAESRIALLIGFGFQENIQGAVAD